MEIVTNPLSARVEVDETLKIDLDNNVCLCCNNVLRKKLIKSKTREYCGYCRYRDRPFGWCGNTAESHYGGCYCKYEEEEYLYVSCGKCSKIRCVKCMIRCGCDGKGCIEVKCKECVKKEEFHDKWRKSTIEEKLNFYGIRKLKIFAKKKQVKGFSKYAKSDLIKILVPLMDENDFIRSSYET